MLAPITSQRRADISLHVKFQQFEAASEDVGPSSWGKWAAVPSALYLINSASA